MSNRQHCSPLNQEFAIYLKGSEHIHDVFFEPVSISISVKMLDDNVLTTAFVECWSLEHKPSQFRSTNQTPRQVQAH